VSLWHRLKARFGGAPEPEPAPVTEAAPEPIAGPAPEPGPDDRDVLAPIEELARGSADSELALSCLLRARGTQDERRALELVRRAHATGRAPEALRSAAAELHASRGENEQAAQLLEGVRSPAALLLAADIHAELGELGMALTLVERVMARDIEAPGARERHARWRAALGRGAEPARAAADQPTVLRTDAPETSLRIVGEAGRGGAGAVYEAIDDALGRRVALKVYHRPDREQDKLEREARAAVRFAGRGVVRIFDVDTARGFIVMEWLSGRALKHWIVRGDHAVLSPIERWLVPLTQALARIHAASVVHGDLKPANVVFRTPDEPVLTDFGLAQDVGAGLPGGSFGYVSPERLERESADPADDVYALGRLLEDALEALERTDPSYAAGEEARRLRPLAERLLAGRERPPNAGAVLLLLDGAGPGDAA
jgi:tRNA A-37 threonylcarbamoyl transferase component Bud32